MFSMCKIYPIALLKFNFSTLSPSLPAQVQLLHPLTITPSSSSTPPPSHHHPQLKFNSSTLSPSPPAQVHLPHPLTITPSSSSSPPPSHHHPQLKFISSTLSPSPPSSSSPLAHPHTVLKFIYPRPPFTSCPPSPPHSTQVTKDPHLPVTQIKHDLEEVSGLKLTLDQATYSLDVAFSIRSFLSDTVPASFPGREALTGEYTQR